MSVCVTLDACPLISPTFELETSTVFFFSKEWEPISAI